MIDLVVSSFVVCAWCGRKVSVRDLADHEQECRQREHPTQERFE